MSDDYYGCPRLLVEIEEEEINDSKELMTIWSLGGAGCAVRIERRIIYIDPFLSPQELSRPFHRAIPVPFPPEQIRKATAVVSTHEHRDHCEERTVKAFQKNTDATFVGPVSCVKKALEWGYDPSRVVTMRPNEQHNLTQKLSILSFRSNDPYAESALTYLVRTSRGNVFHSGDTNYFEGLREIGSRHRVAVALLNFGKQIPTPEKPYYMSADDVAAAARDLNAGVVIPIHWDLWVEAKDDPHVIESKLKMRSPTSRLRILNVGERFDL